jgi:hypothetical protein
MQAIDVLLSHGVQEEKILFLNLVSLEIPHVPEDFEAVVWIEADPQSVTWRFV